MKKGLLAWNIILSLLVVFLLIKQLSSGKGKTSTSKTSVSDSLHFDGTFRMAYFEMDSVAANFELVKDLKSDLVAKEDAINKELAKSSKDYQDKLHYYQDLDQNGKLTEAQREAAKQELDNMNEAIKSRKQEMDLEYNNFTMTKQNDIKSKIEDFLKEYNRNHNFSYIVSYEQGLFYYKDTAYNITIDVVKGLNEKYKPGKK